MSGRSQSRDSLKRWTLEEMVCRDLRPARSWALLMRRTAGSTALRDAYAARSIARELEKLMIHR